MVFIFDLHFDGSFYHFVKVDSYLIYTDDLWHLEGSLCSCLFVMFSISPVQTLRTVL